MKKFLVFLVSLVIVVCAGLTTYYFLRNNEIITIKTKEIYCNAGDTIPVSSLGINIKKKNVTKKTTFDYNAGGEDVTKYIKYDNETSSYVVSTENAGNVTLIIRSSNKKYDEFKINVHIGNGTEENPFFIFNETTLAKTAGSQCYKLMNDITVTSNFKPISKFGGTFDGNGHTIKGLTVVDGQLNSVGLFTSLDSGAVVKDLTISDASISGEFTNAGVLAGESSGKIERVAVKNSQITNTKNGSSVGALVGSQTKNSIKMSYADSVEITMGNETNAMTKSVVGGFVGKINKSTIQATYVNNIKINATDVKTAGGFVGEFEIGETLGTIQQSYANTECEADNFTAFVGTISKAASFDMEQANFLRHLIGNFAIANNAKTSTISDADLVGNFPSDVFVAPMKGTSIFDNSNVSQHLVKGYASKEDAILVKNHIFYAIDSSKVTYWDSTYVWNTSAVSLPTLKMGSVYPTNPTIEYLQKDLEVVEVQEDFREIFQTNINGEKISLSKDEDLTAGWTPVSIENTVIYGNGKTIRINLNKAVGGNLGLFTTINNSLVKDLNIVVTGVSANADNAGALAAVIFSSVEGVDSSIENVTVTYEDNFETPSISEFGGLASFISNATISNSTVKDLKINQNANISRAAGIVTTVGTGAKIENCSIENSELTATKQLAGVAVENYGEILNVRGNANLIFNNEIENAEIGGIVANNEQVVEDSNMQVNISIKNAGENALVGGAAANNSGSIENVTILGEGILSEVSSSDRVNIGGIAAINSGSIVSSNNAMKSVGTCNVGANHYVGGVAAINSGKINQVLVQSDLSGNYVAGVVVEMNNAEAEIDQVVVGVLSENGAHGIEKNIISADKYAAGSVVVFQNGNMTNLQLSSTIKGEANTARNSLIALVFSQQAVMTQVTVDSEFDGYGTNYREVWTDFASHKNKAEFGETETTNGDARFNLYQANNWHGTMQHVVINSSNNGVKEAKSSFAQTVLLFWSEYEKDGGSFVLEINSDGFNNVANYNKKHEIAVAKNVFGADIKISKTWHFTVGSIWEADNGIKLAFITGITERTK